MDIPASIFAWLLRLSVMQEGYVASRNPPARGKGPGTVSLTQQATNAVLSGHALYYVCYNVSFAQGVPFTTATLVGAPGDETSPQTAAYNWQILSDVFGSLGFDLPAEHRELIVAGDTRIVAELLKDLFIKFSGEASQEAQAKRWASPVPQMNSTKSGTIRSGGGGGGGVSAAILTPLPNREGAASVDSGLKQLKDKKKQQVSGKFTSPSPSRLAASGSVANTNLSTVSSSSVRRPRADAGVEQSRQRYLAKLDKEREAEERKADAARRAEDLRLRMTEGIDYSRYQTDSTETLSKYPVFQEFQNRGAVNFCLGLVLEIVDAVESGEAQETLAAKERARDAARKAAKERKARGQRLLDVASPVHLTPDLDHRTALMVASIVKEDIVELAMKPDVHQILQGRQELREKERQRVENMLGRLERQLASMPKGLKRDEMLKLKEQEEARQRQKHSKKMDRLRSLNNEAAAVAKQRAELLKEEKEAKEKAEKEAAKRREAEHVLYIAEQKARVLERRREKELEAAEAAERKKREEEEARAERRRNGQDLNRKLQQKEQQRLKSMGKTSAAAGTPVTLSAFNHGTGDHAGYFGETLGWQYLTEAEFDVAQMLCQARSDPPSMIPCLEQQLADLQGRSLMYADENGRRHPCPLAEGRAAILQGIEYLGKAKAQKPLMDVSIGLTLAARQHAIDMAHHGVAQTTHSGSDGSTVSQRVARYGACAVRSGLVELVSCVVRPSTLRLGPVDVITRFIVGDGDPTRTQRKDLFNVELFESAGIGHALAEFEGLVVEAYVVLLSFAFMDKPVAQMAAGHHHGVKAVAAPFLDGIRRVNESMADRRRLMTSGNIAIGRLVDAQPNVAYLSNEKLRRRKFQHGAEGDDIGADGNGGSLVPPSGQRNTNASMSPFADSDDDDDDHARSPSPPRERTAAEEAEHQARKKRLSRFYRKYAPAKVNIVDDALVTFDGRFGELIELLTKKYGPEPPETPPPEAAVRREPPPEEAPAPQKSAPASARSKPDKSSSNSNNSPNHDPEVDPSPPAAAAKDDTAAGDTGRATSAASASRRDDEPAADGPDSRSPDALAASRSGVSEPAPANDDPAKDDTPSASSPPRSASTSKAGSASPSRSASKGGFRSSRRN